MSYYNPVPPPQYYPLPPQPQRKSKIWLVLASVLGGVLLLAGVATGTYLYLSPSPQPSTSNPIGNAIAPMTSPPQPSAVTEPPQTETVTAAPGPATSTEPDSSSDFGSSSDPGGASGVPGTYTVDSCTTDGVHLYARVTLQNLDSHPDDFVGTMIFSGSDGTPLGQGGFSAAGLPAGGQIVATVDTGDPQDKRASETAALPGHSDVLCSVSNFHYDKR